MKAALFLSALAPVALAEFRPETTGDSLKLFDGDTLITEYRTDSHFPYLYPLVGPDGVSLTRHFPMRPNIPGEASDHPHHRSFWFTHGDVNGHDFWHSPDHQSTIAHQSFKKVENGTFTVALTWQHKEEALLQEERTYHFEKPDEQSLVIKVTSHLTAATEVTFGDTKEGSFALRVAPTLRHEGPVAKGSIINSEGKDGKAAWGQQADWVCYHGPDAKGNQVALTLMDHPDNLRHPTRWHARSYGLLTANPFGEKGFTKKGNGSHTLKKGQTLTQQYALVIQSGPFRKTAVEEAYRSFAAE